MAMPLVSDESPETAVASTSYARITTPWFPGPIVLGLARCEPERGPAAIALALARERGARLQLVSVVEPPRDVTESDPRRDALRESERRRELGSIAPAAADRQVPVELTIERGCAVTRLVERATALDASLIVLGLRDPTVPAPPFEDETVLRVRRRAPVPVLAVTASTVELPAVGIAATDFSQASLNAARAAAAVMRSGGTLYLAHVRPDFTSAISRGDRIEHRYGHGVAGAFESLVRRLALPPGVRVEQVVLEGAPLQALSAFADEVQAGLIAVGTSRGDMVGAASRMHVGTTLIRQRRYSVLATPASHARNQRLGEEA